MPPGKVRGSWIAVLELRLTEAGLSGVVARELAVELFCSIEGAFLLSRATRSTEAMDVTGRAGMTRIANALAAATS